MQKIGTLIENFFLLIVLIFSLAALIEPEIFAWIKPHIPKLLGVIMFGMGVTLKFSDFLEIWDKKNFVFLGFVLQFTVMPLTAFVISKVFGLSEEIFIGMVIVGSCPGGTASNVIAYLAKANVALSVTMTLFSTFLAPLVTPVIIYFLLSHDVHIEFFPMVESVFWVVLFPLIDGLVIRHFLQKKFDKVLNIFPSISILTITLIIACVVALNKSLILTFPVIIFLAVITHNTFGLSVGYWTARLLRVPKKEARTISIEVGMQNSGLAVNLATTFFSAASALPGAIFSLWHNISGITLAKYWSGKK